jgi:hypothetical protein
MDWVVIMKTRNISVVICDTDKIYKYENTKLIKGTTGYDVGNP